MTTTSELARVAAILREDIARAKADGLVIVNNCILRRASGEDDEIVAVNVLGAVLCRMRRADSWTGLRLAIAAHGLSINAQDLDAIVAGFEMGDHVHADPWRQLGQALAREEGLS